MQATGPGAATHHTPAYEELERLRAEIDRLDDDIVHLIGERLRLARRAGAAKRAARLPLRDRAREELVLRRATVRARELGVRADIVRRLFLRLLDLSRETQAEGTPES